MTSDLNNIRKVGCLYTTLNVCIGQLIATHTEILQGSNKVEGPQPSERVTTTGGDDGRRSIRDGVGVDGKWKYQRIYQGP